MIYDFSYINLFQNRPAAPQNLRRIKQRKAPSSDAKLMIRPAGDTTVLSK